MHVVLAVIIFRIIQLPLIFGAVCCLFTNLFTQKFTLQTIRFSIKEFLRTSLLLVSYFIYYSSRDPNEAKRKVMYKFKLVSVNNKITSMRQNKCEPVKTVNQASGLISILIKSLFEFDRFEPVMDQKHSTLIN
jgi:hypothetical protein